MHPLPELLAEIAAVAGFDAALKIAAAKGGIRAYFPRHPDAGHWLSLAVGMDTARKIGEHLASGLRGIELDVPMGPNLSQAARWRRIEAMSAEGRSRATIARVVGCHHKTVQRIVNGKRKTIAAALAQADLFEG